MKRVSFLIALYFCMFLHAHQEVQWSVVGAGPAGIAVVGLLLDLGVEPSKLAWIDPEFDVGRLSLYTNVPGNAKTFMYIDFVNACKVFQECKSPALDALKGYDLQVTPSLHMIVEPLRDITKHLQKKVLVKQSILTSLYFEQDQWVVGIKSENKTEYLKSRYVVLATGSHPRKLQYPTTKEIPLDIAVDKAQLAKQVVPEDVVGVLGSAHSAILILKFLSELPVKKIVNFYKNPIVYATEMGDWVLHQHSGLKGITAEWAKNVLEKNPPKNLVRIFNDPKIMARLLPLCTKIIYAVGFDRNQLPLIDGKTEITYDDHTGIIASRLFGIGIAFPEKYVDPLGNVEHQVGLKFFMEYAQKMVPEWMKKDVLRYFSFEDLFMINVL